MDLPAGGELRITSALDGEVQQLNAAELVMWDNSSAYFNGDTVYLELIAAPGARNNRVVLNKVATQIINYLDGPCAGDDCGICGTDDRVPSSELFTGRLLPVGCTGTIYNPSSCVVSAGHCAQSGLVIQFNVPASNSNCATNNPPVADQFPITNFQYQNAGIGADWSVMIAGTNSSGQHPFDRYGVYRSISPTLASPGNEASDWSYGVDNGQPTRSQIQQYSTGTIGSRASTYYTFSVDITYGSSGSSLQHANQIIGIVTHCSIGCPDYATRIDLAAFVSARNSLCPDATAPTPDPMSFATPPTPQSTAAITMTATTATDPSLPVSYDFTFVSGGSGGNSSGWVTTTTYVDSGLSANTAYTYKVRARDAAPTPNMTAYSSDQTTATYIQTPTGVAFGAVTASTIDLSATGTLTNLAVGTSGLYFDSTTVGGDGGLNVWVQTNSDQATGLTPDTLYTFQVKARNQNSIETAYGSTNSKATLAAVPAAPTLSNPTQTTLQLDVAPNGNPAITSFAVKCTATSPQDTNWNGQYAGGTGQPGAAETWLTDAQWGTLTINGLQPNTTYTFAVKARNQESVQTAFGPGASLATPPPTGACCRDYNASCEEGILQADCAGPHDTWFEGQTCAQAACPPPPPPTGACCVAGGICQQLTQEDCGLQGGTWHGGPCVPCLCATCVGDTNCDTIIDFDDINPFVAAISGGIPCNLDNCDMNCDGIIDFDDINPFVTLLSTGAMCP